MPRVGDGSLSVIALATCVLVANCATATGTKSDDRLFIDSKPGGASIFVNGMFAGTTPQLVPMPRDHTIEIRCSLSAFQDWTTNVHREVAPAAALDAPIFAVVDQISGAAYRLQRKTLFVELTPIARPDAGP
jgi:hypothetical protein